MMRKRFFLLAILLLPLTLNAGQREAIWPKGKMPHAQSHQIAAMTDEQYAEGFNPDKHRYPYLEWYEAPSKENRTDICMILISGGSYECCCDVDLVKYWAEQLTSIGIQCVNFVYRTPRPEGIPIYQTAWEDGQRAVRVVRSQARKRGYDPEKIAVMGMSAGGHLTLLLATNSQTPAYQGVDAIDTLPCHINLAVANAPAYTTTDSESGTPSTRQGYGPDVRLSACFNFDSGTCPLSIHHGGDDIFSPNGSTLVYREMRKAGVPCELHLYADMPHGAFGFERAVEFMRQVGFLGELQPEENLMERYSSDESRAELIREDLWPEGKMPDRQDNQCEPYIEWHIPAVLKTKAIQIIYSGGAYDGNNPDGFEVAPARRFLNDRGMTVVTMKYRTPRPSVESGLAKHVTAWQDLQRAIRIVRSEAASRGLDPDKIGIMGSSAGGHLTLMGVTSSLHRSYYPIDELDNLKCNVQWGIGIYPAYVLVDGADGFNADGGNEDSDVIVPDFSFDLCTSPMLFIHGDKDPYSSMGSVKVWEKMRAMGVQCELHTLAKREHCFQHVATPGTGSYTYLERIWEFLNAKGFVGQ